MSIITWDNANFTWNNNSFTWDEVVLIQEILRGPAPIDNEPWNQWTDKKKKKKLIKLILKVHGNTITESKQKQIKQYKIKVSDIKLAIKNIPNIEIMTENVKF